MQTAKINEIGNNDFTGIGTEISISDIDLNYGTDEDE